MKKIIYSLVLFMLFVSRVDALSYNISTKVNSLSNNIYEIRVSLNEIKDTNYGVAACLLDVELSGGATLNGNIRSLDSWSITLGDSYLLDSSIPKKNNSDFLVIPVKVTSNGTISINNISCSDGEQEVSISDKVVNLTYSSNNTSNNVQNNKPVVKSSNCDLSDIKLSEGSIEFDSSVLEYTLEVNNYSKLEVEPILADATAKYDISRTEESVSINVTAEDGTKKTYILYVTEKEEIKEEKKSKKFVPIFIGIVCLLVIVNIIRVARKFVDKS